MKFRKIPVVIEAIKHRGSATWKQVYAFLQTGNMKKYSTNLDETLMIETSNEDMKIDINDWIIRDVNGELYSCKPDIFEKTYEKVEG
jgi:hypothetical protein